MIILLESQKLMVRWKWWVNESKQNTDNYFGINCTQEEQNKCLFNSGKQIVANLVEETELPNNHTQLEAKMNLLQKTSPPFPPQNLCSQKWCLPCWTSKETSVPEQQIRISN